MMMMISSRTVVLVLSLYLGRSNNNNNNYSYCVEGFVPAAVVNHQHQHQQQTHHLPKPHRIVTHDGTNPASLLGSLQSQKVPDTNGEDDIDTNDNNDNKNDDQVAKQTTEAMNDDDSQTTTNDNDNDNTNDGDGTDAILDDEPLDTAPLSDDTPAEDTNTTTTTAERNENFLSEVDDVVKQAEEAISEVEGAIGSLVLDDMDTNNNDDDKPSPPASSGDGGFQPPKLTNPLAKKSKPNHQIRKKIVPYKQTQLHPHWEEQ